MAISGLRPDNARCISGDDGFCHIITRDPRPGAVPKFAGGLAAHRSRHVHDQSHLRDCLNPRPQLRPDPQHYLLGQLAFVFPGMHSDSAAFSGNAPGLNCR